MTLVSELMRTERLIIREWSEDDVTAARAIYGRPEVARWLSPAVEQVTDDDGMRVLLQSWIADTRGGESGLGHWAVTISTTSALVGGVSLHELPVDEQDVEVGWQIAPEFWGRGYASEAGRGVIERGFRYDVDEVFALVRPHNRRAEAVARRIGMTWVGETDKYYDLRLNVYRLRSSDRT